MTDLFEKELKALLEKYDMTICLDTDDGSDWHGITGEKMIAYNNKTGESQVLVEDSTGISSTDL